MYQTYVENLVEEGQLPGAVLYVARKKELKHFQAYGSFTDIKNSKQPISLHSLFDVASLTKIMATLPSTLFLHSLKELDLADSVSKYISQFRYRDVTINHLLEHSSGLPADLPYKDRYQERDVLKEVVESELTFTPGSQTKYSDLGMILLGKIVEKVADEPLDTFVKKNIFEPWGLHDTTYLLPEDKKVLTASTELYQDTYIQGEVHDEKAFQLGGVSGSAGLFSTAEDVAKYSHYWLYPEEQSVIHPELMKQAVKHRKNNRGLGFEVWSGVGEVLSCGDKWPIGSFGHTGFTGTSVWVDPINEIRVVFLTNAVHFGRNTQIKEIRKTLHSLIYSSLTRGDK